MKDLKLIKDKETKNKTRYQVKDGNIQLGTLYFPHGETPPTEVRFTIVNPE